MSAPPPKLAAARLLNTLLEAGERMGVDRALALRQIRVTADEAKDPSGWIPASSMTRAWEIVPAMSEDPCFGLHAAEATPLGVFGPLDLATMSSATVSDALHRVVRYYATMGVMSDLRLATESDGSLRLTIDIRVKHTGDLRHYVENLFALVVTRIQMAAMASARGDVDVAVRFAHPAPASTTEHVRIFGKRVQFGAGRDELAIGHKTASMTLVTSNPELSPLLEREGRRLGLRPDAPIAERVRTTLEQTMREGSVELEQVARKLTLGPRTLQRMLKTDGTSFAEVLDAARREIALKTLEGGGAVTSELAYMLGFSQPGAFYRAFRRWTGKSPRQWKSSPGVGPPKAARSAGRPK